MLETVTSFFNNLPADMKNFIVGTSSKLTADLLMAIGRKTDDTKDSLGKAFEEGIKYFVKSLQDNDVDLDYIRKLLSDDAIKSVLINIVKDESLAKDTILLRNELQKAGIDVETIKGFDINVAITSFLNGFILEAERSKDSIPFLELQILRKILKQLEEKKPDLHYLKSKYFNFLKEKYSYITFKGLSEGKLISFPLEKIYTNLSFAEALPSSGTEYLSEKEETEKEEKEKVDFIEDIQRRRAISLSDILNPGCSVITGDPGAGKSTLLKYIALAFVDRKGIERLKISDDLLPVIFPVVAYAEAYKKSESVSYSLKEFIPEFFKGQGLPDLSLLFKEALDNETALILIDGLDEVADDSERKKIVEDIKNFIIDVTHEINRKKQKLREITGDQGNEKRKKNKYIITCRTASYTKTTRFEPVAGNNFTHYRILPFGIDDIKEFLFNWYCCYEKEIHHRFDTYKIEATKKLMKMSSILRKNKYIYDIARNPLMLTILALIEHEGGELPRNRAELYSKCIRMLSGSWEKLRSLHERENHEFKLGDRKITEDFIVTFLGPIAFEMHEKFMYIIEYEDLKERLAKGFDVRNRDILLSKEQADDFIKIMKERSGILQEFAIGVYGFMHLTFKEYLAARVLTDLCDNRLHQLSKRLFVPEWREVILLTASSMKRRDTTNFIRGIYETKASDFKNLLLALECLIVAGRDKIEDELYDSIIKETLKIIEGGYKIRDRFYIAEKIGWIGDSRNLEEFVPIESGEFNLSIGTSKIAAFEIGKYPVTNVWFERFINDAGYTTKDYWSNEGRRWLDYKRMEQPEMWNDREWSCPNSPVIGISWYEAYAFTQWLTKKRNDGYEYRLPTETEWEAAATGFENRYYPWGADGSFNVNGSSYRCNIRGMGIGKISPVGIIKEGNTPEGISDLGGNVWEWTRSDYYSYLELNDFRFEKDMCVLLEQDSYTGSRKSHEKHIQLPVLRGGSFSTDLYQARCACRRRYFPFYRTHSIGFRCLRIPK